MVRSRATRNCIDCVTDIHGTRVDGDHVPLAFVDHYMAFLGQQGDTHPFISNLFSNKLTDNVANHMIHSLMPKEVRDAIFSMGDDNSPGQLVF